MITAKIANVVIEAKRVPNRLFIDSPYSFLRTGNRMLYAAAAISSPNTKKNGAIALP